jgi:superoxide dismutase, Fe-Mn family
MTHELPKLPYAYDALEPFIDKQTMEIHYTKHHKTYVDKLNAALESAPDLKIKTVEELLKNLNSVPEAVRTAVRNHGGGHYNHSLFWHMMAPNAGGTPSGTVAEEINKKFSSFEKFKEAFANSAVGVFGSGWTWLVWNGKEVEIVNTSNQDSPLSSGKTPLLGIDVWEHSYYLKFQNKRADYVAVFWNVVNWKQVEENLKNARK